ncbi:MAG: glycosyltransferase family 2 protein [Lachnospiraceae bacterium]|nr:glycosyltransferase family 2 protein [Lachnospiraceae bacterium]
MNQELITIGITTWNRMELLKRMALSLSLSEKPFPYEIKVYDDCSTEYDAETLREIFPEAVSIIRHDRNKGADLNAEYMYHDFLENGGDYLFNADSDLIFSADWMEVAVSKIGETDGVLSLFNTKQHPGKSVGNGLVEKEAIGCAGTFFSREIIEAICASRTIHAERGIDWEWSRFLQEEGIRIFTTERSYVQHIGFIGDHSGNGLFDYGSYFHVGSLENGQIINDSIEEFSHESYAEELKYVRKLYLFPYDRIEKSSRVVLYGAGNVGRDFRVQIANGNYCRLVATVDKNYAKQRGVLPPSSLKDLEFDYIIVATCNEELSASILIDLKTNVNISDERIVTVEGMEPISLRVKDMI